MLPPLPSIVDVRPMMAGIGTQSTNVVFQSILFRVTPLLLATTSGSGMTTITAASQLLAAPDGPGIPKRTSASPRIPSRLMVHGRNVLFLHMPLALAHQVLMRALFRVHLLITSASTLSSSWNRVVDVAHLEKVKTAQR